jgi:hypothetical protein
MNYFTLKSFNIEKYKKDNFIVDYKDFEIKKIL